ncbi:MAG: TPM domain-containing protein [Lachnospiraceae bacterium]|nr:TPM domain-containing protein [Lachnospiraceae bacterium]
MKKKLYVAFFALLLCIAMTLPAFAAESLPRLVDDADLLSDSEEEVLLDKLDDISSIQGMDVVIVTVDSTGDWSTMEYADDFYDYNGYAEDGILLLVSMEERDWCISTAGYGITAFTDAGQKYLAEQFLEYLTDGDYANAFDIFADQCDDFITQAKTGQPYDSGSLPKKPFLILSNLLIALGGGIILAFLITGSMKSRMKTVRMQPEAASYMVPGSMQVSRSHEMFLYKNVDRTAKQEKGSSTHTSSSGNTHGGSGGKF